VVQESIVGGRDGVVDYCTLTRVQETKQFRRDGHHVEIETLQCKMVVKAHFCSDVISKLLKAAHATNDL
jgi:hypothetical protein